MSFPTGGTAPVPGPPGADAFSTSAGAPPAHLLAALQRISGCAARPAELAHLLRTVADEVGSLLRASATTATREPGNLLALRVGSGILSPCEGEVIPLEGSFCGAALASGEARESGGLAGDPHAYPVERAVGAGPALAVPLPAPSGASGVLLVVRPAGAPPFDDGDRQTLTLLAGFAGAALAGALAFSAARASRAAAESWRREREAAAWRLSCDAVLAEKGRALFQVELASGRIRWGSGVEALAGLPGGAWGDTVEAWAHHMAAGERDRVVRALTAGSRVSRLGLSLAVAGGQVKRFHLDTFPDAAEPGILAALLTVERAQRLAPVAELIRAVRHELNNPLAVVAGTVHLMEASGAAEGRPDLARSVQQIRDASDRLRDLSSRIALVERMPEAAFVTEAGGLGVAVAAGGAP